MPHLVKLLIWTIVWAVVAFLIAFIASNIISTGGSNVFAPGGFQTPYFSIIFIVLLLGLVLYWLTSKAGKKKDEGGSVGSKTKKGDDMEQYFDSRWVTEKELKTEKRFMFCTWGNVGGQKDGMFLRSQVDGSSLHINMYKPIHQMVIGSSGTGKTQRLIMPALQVLSSTKTKPSFVISDLKGEIYEKCSNKLKKEGYDVKVFNLRQPYASACWNPLDNAFMMYQQAFHLQEQVVPHQNVNPADTKLKVISHEYNYEWYEFNGIAYPNKDALMQDLNSKKAELIDLAENELREIATVLCPIENKNDASWDRGAQEFVYGTMLAMLEDSLKPELGMTRQKFNFYNLARICNYKDPDPDNPYKTLRQYYTGRNEFSKVMALISTAINNAQPTTRSYMGIVGAKLGIFNDSGMCFATSKNEMEFDDFANRPTALFIIVPDEKENRHSIATMMVSQLYKKLVAIANTCPGLLLPRTVYFLLDEFANMPKIEKIDTMITVSRSRNIFFSIVLQSYSQLNAKYGDDAAAVIKGNCPIKVFIGTDDRPTCEEFSKLCGEIALEVTTKSETKQKEDSSKTTARNLVSRPLIYPDELGHLSKESDATGTIIIKILNEFPIKCKATSYWATSMFDHTKPVQEYVPSRALVESETAYSIIQRNNKVLRGNNNFGDDF